MVQWTGAKVSVVIGIIFIVIGGIAAASAPERLENIDWFVMEDVTNGTIEIDDSDGEGEIGLTFWVKGKYLDENKNDIWDVCDDTNITVTKNPEVNPWGSEYEGKFYYEVVHDYNETERSSSCKAYSSNRDLSNLDIGLVKIGRACLGCTSGVFEFESNQSVWVTYDDKNGEQFFEAIIPAAFGGLACCCGILLLIVGGLIALFGDDEPSEFVQIQPVVTHATNLPSIQNQPSEMISTVGVEMVHSEVQTNNTSPPVVKLIDDS